MSYRTDALKVQQTKAKKPLVICANCTYHREVGYSNKCAFPGRLERDFVSGEIEMESCAIFNYKGQCQEFQAKPPKKPSWFKRLFGMRG